MLVLMYEVIIYYITGKVIEKRYFNSLMEARAFIKTQPHILYRYNVNRIRTWLKELT
jgi:hypothetical protein